MKTIDKYVNGIFKEFDKNDEDTKILIEETKSHLYDEVEDLKKQGFSEEESINKAISNFGKETSVINELKGTLKKQDKLFRILSRIVIIMFCIGTTFKLIFFCYNLSSDIDNKWEKYTKDESCSRYVFNNIQEKLLDKDSIDDNLKDEITQFLDEFNARTDNGIYYIEILKGSDSVYEYSKEISSHQAKAASYLGTLLSEKEGEDKGAGWNIEYNLTDAQDYYDITIVDNVYETFRKLGRLNDLGRELILLSWAIACVAFLDKIYKENKMKICYLAYHIATPIILLYVEAKEINVLDSIVVFLVGGLIILSTAYNKKFIENKISLE